MRVDLTPYLKVELMHDAEVCSIPCPTCGHRLIDKEVNPLAYSNADQKWWHNQCAVNAKKEITAEVIIYAFSRNALVFEHKEAV